MSAAPLEYVDSVYPIGERAGSSLGYFYNMKDNTYITIQSWMRDRLGLTGVDLMLYAIIYGFSQDGRSFYAGSTKYLVEWTGVSEDSVLRHLRKLTESGILIKKGETAYGAVKRVFYIASDPQNACGRPAKCDPYDPQNAGRATRKMQVNNNSIDNNRNDIIVEKEPQLFVEDNTRAKNTLFRNSALAIQGNDYQPFLSRFQGGEYDNIDLVYYYHAVADWSDSKNVKRTERGWMATIRNFIRSDIERGKVHRISSMDIQANIDAINYLNNDL